MKKYMVLITRDYTHVAHIVVEADSEKEAEELALDQISNEELTLDGIVPDSDSAEVQGKIQPLPGTVYGKVYTKEDIT